MVSILFGGLAGLYLALNATGGWVAQLGFDLLAIGWLFTMFQALVHIKKKYPRPSEMDAKKLCFNLRKLSHCESGSFVYGSIWL